MKLPFFESEGSQSSSSMLLYVHRDRTDYYSYLGMGSPGWPPRLSHSSWALEKKKNQFKFSVALRPHRDHKAYHRRGSQDGHLDFHTAPEIQQANVCHNSRRRYAREVTMFLKGRGISWTLFWFDLKGLAHADLAKKTKFFAFFNFFFKYCFMYDLVPTIFL